MLVLFFHGFQLGDDYENAHVTTWQSGDESCIWPQTWLVDEFPGAHILAVSYHGGLRTRREAKKEDGKVDLYIIAENIMSDLRQAKIGQEAGCPIILVGHSFGGLVIKNLCWHAHTKSSIGSVEDANFLKNVKGIFFYSTPHHGITTDLAKRFVIQRPLFEYVTTLSADAARMHEEFGKLRNYYRTWETAGLGETLPTKLVRLILCGPCLQKLLVTLTCDS